MRPENNIPLVSVITITYNSEATIKDTIDSLLKQTYTNLEYIIVDGESYDKTIEIVNSYKARIEEKNIRFKFLSEKDNGIADAWNKGLKMAEGLIIGMLNSDDWYEDDAVECAVNCLDFNKPQLSYGICKRVDHDKKLVEIIDKEFNPKRIYINFGFSFTTCFMTSKLVKEIGGYNTNYKIAIDTDFLLRCFKKKIKFIKCNNVTYMRLGGVSTKFEKLALIEYQKVLKNNGYNNFLIYLFGLLKRGVLFLKKYNLY